MSQKLRHGTVYIKYIIDKLKWLLTRTVEKRLQFNRLFHSDFTK